MWSRRRVLTGAIGSALAISSVGGALAHAYVDGGAFGLGSPGQDQDQAMRMAIEAASEHGLPLHLGAGTYELGEVTIRRPVSVLGFGNTILRRRSGSAALLIADCEDVVLDGLTFEGGPGSAEETALLGVTNAERITIRNCSFAETRGVGINAFRMEGVIERCEFRDIGDTAIFSTDSGGLHVHRNIISRCGNGAIRIWRDEAGVDGSRITANRITDIDWVGGGNGQNGNGINVFRADGVSVTDNHFTRCAFSAVRLNATNQCIVAGNHCYDSGEVAIFSEFGFSGSIISNNLVEGGAAGISMTNFDHGGRQSVCQGNIVRNLAARSRTNPDTVPFGIAAEADAIITGNIVEAVPGTGIAAGWGPYLRDVLVSNNLVRECTLGIVVSVAPGAGQAVISGNVVSESQQHSIAGAHWRDIVSPDLTADVGTYPNVALHGNTVRSDGSRQP